MPETLLAITAHAIFAAAETALQAVGIDIFNYITVAVVASQVAAAVVLAAAAYGLASLLTPSATASDGQWTLAQPVPFRRRVYGRAKLGGYFIFLDSQNGTLYFLVVLAAHECDGYEEHWLADRQVSIDPTGFFVNNVLGPPGSAGDQFSRHGYHWVFIYNRLGTSGQAAYSRLISDLSPLWTDDYIGIGMTDTLVVQTGIAEKYFASAYPGGMQNYRGVIRGAKILDPRNLATPAAWNDNAICVLYDYLTNADGFRIAPSFFNTGMGLAITQASCDVADELVELVAGGTEHRYRIWGFYDFSEEPRVVLNRMLAAAGAWLEPQPDGTIGIRAGAWVAPTVTISDDYILSYSVQHYVGEFDAINEVRATFTYPQNDYQNQESFPWQDTADITRRGYVRSTTIDARHCPSFTQCRRIQKIGMAEASPEWTIQLVTGPYGLLVRNQRFINLVITELGLNITCRVTKFAADTHTGICTISLMSYGSEAYDWDPTTEEGPPPPIPPSTANSGEIETPTDLVATVIQAGSGAGIQLTVAGPTLRTDLNTQFDIQVAGATDWTTISSGTQSLEVATGQLLNGTYNTRVFYVTNSGYQSDPLEVDGVVVTPADITPAAPTGLAVTGVGSPITIARVTFNAPNDTHFVAAKIYRNSSSVFSGATLIAGPLYGSANQAFTYNDTPGSGTWYYWASSINAASPPGESGHTGPVSLTVP